MTIQNPQGIHLVDPGNKLLGRYPEEHLVGKYPTPDGEIGVLTIWQGNSTMTLFLDKAQAAKLAEDVAALRDALSTGLVVPRQGLIQGQAGQR